MTPFERALVIRRAKFLATRGWKRSRRKDKSGRRRVKYTGPKGETASNLEMAYWAEKQNR